MDIRLSKEEIAFALYAYLAFKGYTTDGHVTTHYSHGIPRNFELKGITFKNVKHDNYNAEEIVKKIREI